MNSKKDLILDKLRLLTSAIQERQQIAANLTRSIDDNLHSCQDHIFQLEYSTYAGLVPEWERRKLDLEKERRNEMTSYFRDLSNIKKELRDTFIEYIKEKQSEALFK